jgi:hypothetical protein
VAGDIVSQAALNSATAAGFRGGRTIHSPDGLTIRLLLFQPVSDLQAFPGGPPLLPRKGYIFVGTRWSVRNITSHTVTIKTWKARSRGMWSSAFITGNAPEPDLVLPEATNQYFWLFQVARTGRVAIFYGSFPARWLPRGR